MELIRRIRKKSLSELAGIVDRQAKKTVVKLFKSIPQISLTEITNKQQYPLAPLIDEDICMPPHISHRKDHNDFDPMMQLVMHKKPSIVLELGTAHGNTVANICANLPEVKVVTVNAPIDTQSGEITTYELTKEEIGRVYKNNNFSDRVTQVFQNTLELDLTNIVEKKSVDFCIIDACHDTDYVVNDFHKIYPYLTTGAIVLLHDTHPSMKGHLAGSYTACSELRKEGFDIKHLKKTWWGIFINK